jgi:TM2 domain-containing membrane protein YozV
MTMDPTPPTNDPDEAATTADDAGAPEPSAAGVAFSDVSPAAAAAADTPPAEATPAPTPAEPPAAPVTAPGSAEAIAAVEQQVAEAQPAGYEAPAAQARGPQAQQPAEPGWWQASDGWWYPPESAPTATPQYAEPAAAYAVPGQYAVAGQPPATYPQQYPPGAQPKSRMAAGLLGVFLGSFGVHRFYLGYTNIGIIQIIATVFTCGLAGIWGFVEGILILMKNDNFLTDADGVPLAD